MKDRVSTVLQIYPIFLHPLSPSPPYPLQHLTMLSLFIRSVQQRLRVNAGNILCQPASDVACIHSPDEPRPKPVFEPSKMSVDVQVHRLMVSLIDDR